MLVLEQELDIPAAPGHRGLLEHLGRAAEARLPDGQIPIRVVVTRSDAQSYHCELGVLAGMEGLRVSRPSSLFQFAPRRTENTDRFSVVLVVPTGIGAEIGGHAGDAGPVARLLASACDTLITHPNVVNASDINELPENGLCVEGSVLSRLLMGTAGLQRVRSNRVLLVIDEHEDPRICELVINAASAARASMGLDCPRVVKLAPPIRLRSRFSGSGRAAGRVEGLERLCDVLLGHRSEYDAVALASVIDVPESSHVEYYEAGGEMVNPWGGVEALLTHAASLLFDVPSAHAPMFESMEIANLDLGVVDPRMSAEVVSMCFLHSVLKGLHRSPRIISDAGTLADPGVLTAADVSCLVIPDGCIGLPTLAALEQGIPVIAVRENRNRMLNDLSALPFASGKLFIVENYLEAAGVMTALKAGVAVPSVRRPLAETPVRTERSETSAAEEHEATNDPKKAEPVQG